MSFVQTFSGKRFYPLYPKPSDIDPLDIAHHLSQVCRFTGASKRFYSVAEHSVRVARRVKQLEGTERDQLWALLHDASEAYIADVSRPVKGSLDGYGTIERNIMLAVCARFALPPEMPALVRRADDELLTVEAVVLMSPIHPEWALTPVALPCVPARDLGWTPDKAKAAFLKAFAKLTGWKADR